ELARVAVLEAALTAVDLAEVGGELGLLEAPAGDVRVGGDDVAPGAQADGGGGVERRAGGPLLRAAGLLLEAQAQDLLLLAVDLGGLRGGADREQQALDAVEGAVGVVEGEGVLVRPAVTNVAALVDEG